MLQTQAQSQAQQNGNIPIRTKIPVPARWRTSSGREGNVPYRSPRISSRAACRSLDTGCRAMMRLNAGNHARFRPNPAMDFTRMPVFTAPMRSRTCSPAVVADSPLRGFSISTPHSRFLMADMSRRLLAGLRKRRFDSDTPRDLCLLTVRFFGFGFTAERYPTDSAGQGVAAWH